VVDLGTAHVVMAVTVVGDGRVVFFPRREGIAVLNPRVNGAHEQGTLMVYRNLCAKAHIISEHNAKTSSKVGFILQALIFASVAD